MACTVNEIQGNPVSSRYELSRLHGVAAARHTAGSIGLHGRRQTQSAVRRRGELGSDSRARDRIDGADAGIESAVRSEHARRRTLDPDQGRPHDPATTVQPIYGSDVAGRGIRHGGAQRRVELVSRRQPVRRRWLARRFASDVRQCSESSAGSGRHDVVADRGARQQFAERQRPAGTPLPGCATSRASTRSRTTPTTARLREPHDAPHRAASALPLAGNAYYRDIRTDTFNGDINEDSLDQASISRTPAEQAALAAAGYTGFPRAARTPQHAVSVLALHRQRAAATTNRARNATA